MRSVAADRARRIFGGGLRLLRARWPELLLLALGVMLRRSMLTNFPEMHSYDAVEHMKYVTWFRDHLALPSLDQMTESYHPPLYYFIAGRLAHAGADSHDLQKFAVVCGCAQLALFWYGVERWLPGGARARRVALLLAAVMPALVFLDGMLGAEPLSALLATAILVLAPSLFAAEGGRRVAFAVAVSALAGLALLAKISALVLIGALGAGAALELVARPGDASARLFRVATLLAGLVVCSMVCGWYFARNVRAKGKPFVSSFDCSQRNMLERIQGTRYLDRRPRAYLLGWSTEIHARPFWPSAGPPATRFWPQLIATTFGDYYNYGYVREARPGEPFIGVNNRRMRPQVIQLARIGFQGGLVIALCATLAWMVALWRVLRARDAGRLVLLAAPLLATVGALHFAWAYPFDNEGIVKGAYLQFASAPLIALFGLAVARLWARRFLFALLPLAALVAVAVYSIACRMILS